MGKISKIVALSLLMSFAISQTTGKIRGKVTSADGQPLAGANVIVDGTTKGAATDGDGSYTILNVEAGTYSVTATYIGYQSSTESNVSIKVDLTTPLNFAMATSAVEGEVVTIVGEKRLIEKSATNSVRSVSSEEIQNSASRSVSGMLDMQAGVNITNGRLSIRGSRAEEVAYTLDGASITDVVNTGRDVSAIPEALAEISVESGGFGAHIGGANSGVVRQTLKTGGNEVMGSARFETGDYGHTDLTATVGVPIGDKIKTFIALRSNHVDDWDPTYYTDFSINNGEMLESTVSGSTPDGDSVQVVFNSGGKDGVAHRSQDVLQINATGTVDLGPLNLRLSAVVDNNTYESNALPIYYMFNTERLPKTERKLSMYNARANYFLNPNMLLTAGLSTFKRTYEKYDDGMGKPGNFGDLLGHYDSTSIAAAGLDASYWAGGNTDYATPGATYNSPGAYYVANTFAFSRPGDILTDYDKNERSSFGFDAGLTWQRGDHEIRTGFDYKKYTYRVYELSTTAMYNINKGIADGNYTREQAASGDNVTVTNALSLYNRDGQIGYDDYGNEVDDGFDGPREPTVTSFYLNDKFESGDLVISAGVRLDNFMMDDFKMKDPANPGWDQSNQGIIEDQFEDSETKSVLQPRIGLAFPVSDQMVFHLQYGKFAQMPELDLPYASTRYMHLVWGGQNYTPDPMGFDLDPIETTQYEVGMSYQFLPSAAIDVTAFAKNTTGQVVIGKNDAVDINNTYGVAQDAFYYKNGDFTTVNGFEFTLRTRRVSNLQTYGSYTWSDARGINSDPNTGAGNIAQDLLSPPPLMISPLYYHNKHRGAVALDYRLGEDQGVLSGLGINFEYKFNSGHPYTLSDGGMGQRAADGGAILADARSREPQESIGGSTTPWQYYSNLKVDYKMSLGGVGVTLFAYVDNLFDTKNVINVYSRSGNAYDDGFLTDPALSSEIVAANGQTYVDLYRNVNLENRQHYMTDFGFDVFATPQIVKMGVAVNF
ncbi:TonB-dependent receptor [Candidatus Marinimicrobia bacterium]|jgi:outer membrane receptor protein involved in Fe transport|nr:TonB-dependent receptor [Candidatus Neomarinimicrobiota bacterium]